MPLQIWIARTCAGLTLLMSMAWGGTVGAQSPVSAVTSGEGGRSVTFTRDVAPIFQQKCQE